MLLIHENDVIDKYPSMTLVEFMNSYNYNIESITESNMMDTLKTIGKKIIDFIVKAFNKIIEYACKFGNFIFGKIKKIFSALIDFFKRTKTKIKHKFIYVNQGKASIIEKEIDPLVDQKNINNMFESEVKRLLSEKNKTKSYLEQITNKIIHEDSDIELDEANFIDDKINTNKVIIGDHIGVSLPTTDASNMQPLLQNKKMDELLAKSENCIKIYNDFYKVLSQKILDEIIRIWGYKRGSNDDIKANINEYKLDKFLIELQKEYNTIPLVTLRYYAWIIASEAYTGFLVFNLKSTNIDDIFKLDFNPGAYLKLNYDEKEIKEIDSKEKVMKFIQIKAKARLQANEILVNTMTNMMKLNAQMLNIKVEELAKLENNQLSDKKILNQAFIAILENYNKFNKGKGFLDFTELFEPVDAYLNKPKQYHHVHFDNVNYYTTEMVMSPYMLAKVSKYDCIYLYHGIDKPSAIKVNVANLDKLDDIKDPKSFLVAKPNKGLYNIKVVNLVNDLKGLIRKYHYKNILVLSCNVDSVDIKDQFNEPEFEDVNISAGQENVVLIPREKIDLSKIEIVINKFLDIISDNTITRNLIILIQKILGKEIFDNYVFNRLRKQQINHLKKNN